MPPKSRPHVPPYTAHAARATFGPDNPYLLVGDQLYGWLEALDAGPLRDTFLDGPHWDDLVLSMVTVFQYVEDLADRQAADAVRTRLDWKHALHLPIDYPGIEYLSLGRYRRRLPEEEAELLAFGCLLDWLIAPGLLGRGQARKGARQVLKTVEMRTWVSEANEAMSRALEAVASLHSDWLRQIALPHWYQRYSGVAPEGVGVSLECTPDPVDAVHGDVTYLLEMVDCAGPSALGGLPEIQALRGLPGGRYGGGGEAYGDAGVPYRPQRGSPPPEAASNDIPT